MTFDIHAHLQFEQFDKDRDDVIDKTREKLNGIITSGINPDDARKALEIRDKYPDFIFVTLGLHPIHVFDVDAKQLEAYLEFIRSSEDEIVGIGEIGLDYHHIRDPMKVKETKTVFIEFLEFAKELKLPVILHLRDAIEDGYKIVIDNDVRNCVFHCYSGKQSLAKDIARDGYWISLATNILHSKKPKKAAKSVDLSLVLTETDSPFLGMGERNDPSNVEKVCEQIASLKGESVEKIKSITAENAKTLFQLK